MNSAVVIGMAYFGSIALVAALAIVVVQAFFVDAAMRLGERLIPCVPIAALGGGALMIGLSKRNLQFDALTGGLSAAGESGSPWISRLANLMLLAIACAKIAQMLFAAQRERGSPRANLPASGVDTAEQAANQRLFIVFLAYAIGSLVLPMVLGTSPAFSHDGIVAVPMFIAVYLARREGIGKTLTITRWMLSLVVVASLVVAAAVPKLGFENRYIGGWIPGLTWRLWGLEAHANHMGALVLYLMLLLTLQGFKSRLVSFAVWTLAFVALVLTQSKTCWFAGIFAAGTLLTYRHGRDAQGRVRPEVIASLCLITALLLSALLFVDTYKLAGHFLDSDAGNKLTTFTGRTKAWSLALDMWMESPMFGYGPDAWSPQHRLEMGIPFATQAHNQLMEALSTGGLCYAASLLLYFVLLGTAALRSARRTRGVTLAIFVVTAARCVFETPLTIGNLVSSDVMMQLLFFMLVINEAPVRPAETTAPLRARPVGRPMRIHTGTGAGYV